MKHILIILFVLINGLFAKAQTDSSACAAFKTGTFSYRHDSLGLIRIVRTVKKQEEYSKEKNIITKYKIKWLSDCSYQLKQVWSNSRQQRKYNRGTAIINITSASKDSYQYSCDCKNSADSLRLSGTVVRLP